MNDFMKLAGVASLTVGGRDFPGTGEVVTTVGSSFGGDPTFVFRPLATDPVVVNRAGVQLGPRPNVDQYKRELQARAGRHPVMLHMEAYWAPTSQPRKPYKVESRIAIIEVSGVLSNDPWYWDETGYGQIQADLKFAAADADVDGILLKIDSPGGYTDGAYETADVIQKVGKTKPVWAVAAPMAYSAAYLLACQAGTIYTPEVSGGVGSIGVYCLHIDYSEALKEHGIKATFIEAGEGKTDGNPYEPLSARAKKDLQADVDRLYAAFVSRVSRGRGVTESEIIALGAFTYEGAEAAIAAGLADKSGTPELAIASMSKATDSRVNKTPLATAGGERDRMENTDETTATAAPNQTAPPVATPANTDALTAYMSDQERIRDLCRLAGCSARVADFQEKKMTSDQVRALLLKEKTEQQTPELNAHVGGLAGIGEKRMSQRERMEKRLLAQGIKPATVEGRV